MSEDTRDLNLTERIPKSGVRTGKMVQFSQRNRKAGAVLDTPPDRDTMEVTTVPDQHTPTPENRQDKRTRLTPNQVEVACGQCGTPLYYFPSQLGTAKRHFCDRLCLGKWRSRQADANAAHWQGGEKVDDGRVYWHLPWHPRADKKGYVPRAIIVAELTIGRPVAPAEVVHHRDENPSNDHPSNLQVLANQAEHARLHGLKRAPEQMAAMRSKRGAA